MDWDGLVGWMGVQPDGKTQKRQRGLARLDILDNLSLAEDGGSSDSRMRFWGKGGGGSLAPSTSAALPCDAKATAGHSSGGHSTEKYVHGFSVSRYRTVTVLLMLGLTG